MPPLQPIQITAAADHADALGIVGTSIGSASFLVQVFQGCVKGFELWRKSEGIGQDAELFQCRLEMAAARLKAWGVDWGLDRGPDSLLLQDRRFQEHGDVAVKYIVLIYHLLDRLGDLGTQFKALSTASNPSAGADAAGTRLLDLANATAPERKALEDQLKRIRDDAGFKERMHWALEDGGPLKTLEQLEQLIHSLEGFLPAPRVDPVAKLAMNSLLATMSLSKLQNITSDTTENSELRGLALLKGAIIEMNARETVFSGDDVKIKTRLLSESTKRDEKSGRSFGTYSKGSPVDVMVEWKLIDGNEARGNHSSVTYKAMLKHRIENLARLLKADFKPSELRTLDCLGVATRMLVGEKLEHGLVFRIPSTHSKTLASIIALESDSLDAGDWYQIAKSVARALLYMHLADWLHKSISSSNILFFAEDIGAFRYDKPYIVGFEYSREASRTGQTESVWDDFQFNLYRHPDAQGLPMQVTPPTGQANQVAASVRVPFSHEHDIYSLGILLLELGLRETIVSVQERAAQSPGYEHHSAVMFRDWILEHEVPKLSSRMGRGYREATRMCLQSDFDVRLDRTIQEDFYLKVIRVLDGYRVD